MKLTTWSGSVVDVGPCGAIRVARGWLAYGWHWLNHTLRAL